MKTIRQWVWENAPVKGEELLTLLAIAEGCDANGGDWHVGISRLAEILRTTPSHAGRLVNRLLKKGCITMEGSERHRHFWVSHSLYSKNQEAA